MYELKSDPFVCLTFGKYLMIMNLLEVDVVPSTAFLKVSMMMETRCNLYVVIIVPMVLSNNSRVL